MKTSGKQDEAWIMSRLMKQLTDMGFPVTGVLFYRSPPYVLPRVVLIVSRPRLSCVTRKLFEGGERSCNLTRKFLFHTRPSG